jgi:hypothetical protein
MMPADAIDGVRERDRTHALWFSTAAFTTCFAAWTIFSIIGVEIKQELSLTDTQFGLLVGTPILTDSLIRLVLGIWADQYGGRIVLAAVMIAAAAATWLLTWAYDYPTFLLAALGVGIAGGSFSVGIAYVSKLLHAPVRDLRRQPRLDACHHPRHGAAPASGAARSQRPPRGGSLRRIGRRIVHGAVTSARRHPRHGCAERRRGWRAALALSRTTHLASRREGRGFIHS